MAAGIDPFHLAVFPQARDQILLMHPKDSEGRMLQSPGLKTSGKFYGFATAADLIVKLPAPRVAELIESNAGAPCETVPGRPMKEWVRLPGLDEEACLSYLVEARHFVISLQ